MNLNWKPKDKIETIIKILSKSKIQNLILTEDPKDQYFIMVRILRIVLLLQKIVDKVGTGDTVLSITSLAVYKLDQKIVLFLGSNICNRSRKRRK